VIRAWHYMEFSRHPCGDQAPRIFDVLVDEEIDRTHRDECRRQPSQVFHALSGGGIDAARQPSQPPQFASSDFRVPDGPISRQLMLVARRSQLRSNPLRGGFGVVAGEAEAEGPLARDKLSVDLGGCKLPLLRSFL